MVYIKSVNWLLDALFPKKCVGCGKLGSGYICDKCQVGLWEETQICPVCARGSRYGLPHSYCHKSWDLDGLTAFWAYDGIAQKLIKKAKYRFFYDYLGELVVESGYLTLRSEFTQLVKFIAYKPVITAVPLHPKRQQWRGFNQAEMIGQYLAKSWHLPYQNLLKRIKNTEHQVGRIRTDRLQNMQGAFAVKKLSLPKNILLVDDVWTTGATLSECATTLKKAGAKTVWGVVLCR